MTKTLTEDTTGGGTFWDVGEYYAIDVVPPQNQILMLVNDDRSQAVFASSNSLRKWQTDPNHQVRVLADSLDAFICVDDFTQYRII